MIGVCVECLLLEDAPLRNGRSNFCSFLHSNSEFSYCQALRKMEYYNLSMQGDWVQKLLYIYFTKYVLTFFQFYSAPNRLGSSKQFEILHLIYKECSSIPLQQAKEHVEQCLFNFLNTQFSRLNRPLNLSEPYPLFSFAY